MLTDEVATYLAAAGLGLTVGGASANLFTVPFPGPAPDASVCIVDDAAQRSEQTFGASLSAPAVERPDLLVMVRDGRDRTIQARTQAYAVYKKLRRFDGTLSGVPYLNIDAEPPQYVGEDANQRPVFSFNCQVFKAESP